MKRFFFALGVLLAGFSVADAGEAGWETIPLPELDGDSAKGLEIECRLLKTEFVVGEPVNMWCTITNTTDSIKPIGWFPNAGLHFCCVQGDKPARGGLLPRAYPQIRSPMMIRSKESRPGYILFLPPEQSIQIVLSYKAERPEKFKGRIVYDPLAPRGGWVSTTGPEEGPPWQDEWVYSNEVEYEIVTPETE